MARHILDPSVPATDGTCFFDELPSEIRDSIYEAAYTRDHGECRILLKDGYSVVAAAIEGDMNSGEYDRSVEIAARSLPKSVGIVLTNENGARADLRSGQQRHLVSQSSSSISDGRPRHSQSTLARISFTSRAQMTLCVTLESLVRPSARMCEHYVSTMITCLESPFWRGYVTHSAILSPTLFLGTSLEWLLP